MVLGLGLKGWQYQSWETLTAVKSQVFEPPKTLRGDLENWFLDDQFRYLDDGGWSYNLESVSQAV